MAELVDGEPGIALRWRAFELRPEPAPTLDPQGEYLTSVWRDHVYPLAAQMGMPLKLPPVQPRTRLAHEAAKWAESQGCLAEYNSALFRAYFEHGEDIGNTEILVMLAAHLGLDSQALADSLKNNGFTDLVMEDEKEARLIGVRAVPAFVAKRRLLAAGVQTAARLQELLQGL